jgi:hypothetical protein
MTPDKPAPPSYLADMVAYYTIWLNSVPDDGRGLHLNQQGAESVSCWVGFTLRYREDGEWDGGRSSGRWVEKAEAETHARLLREVFGNPFRCVSVGPALLTPTVTSLAHAAYDNRTLPAGTLEPDRLAVFADALEEEGCTNAGVIDHLRSPGPHFRGCWAVDLCLGLN